MADRGGAVSGGVGTPCTDTQYVYDTTEIRLPPFNQPADTLNGFLGYYDVDEPQTTCGNCHRQKQAAWSQTAHAGAFADLGSSAQDACLPCHTTGEQGNALVAAAGYQLTEDAS